MMAQATLKYLDMMMQKYIGVTEVQTGHVRRGTQRQQWTTTERLESLVPEDEQESNRATTFLRRRRVAAREQMLPHDPRYKRVF